MHDDLGQGFTKKQFEQIYPVIKDIVTMGIEPQDRKCTVILGGQPGAGKSSFYQSREDCQRYAAINGDEYRKYHPHAREIIKTDPEHYAERTQAFSNRVVETLIKDLSAEGYNLIVEGTMRNPATPINTCLSLKQKGYYAELVVIACDAEEAWKSTLLRAEQQKKHGETPRLVPIDIYNYTVHQIPESLSTIVNSGCFDQIIVQNRDGQQLYVSSLADEQTYPDEILREALDLENWDQKYRIFEADFDRRKIDIRPRQLDVLEHGEPDRDDDFER